MQALKGGIRIGIHFLNKGRSVTAQWREGSLEKSWPLFSNFPEQDKEHHSLEWYLWRRTRSCRGTEEVERTFGEEVRVWSSFLTIQGDSMEYDGQFGWRALGGGSENGSKEKPEQQGRKELETLAKHNRDERQGRFIGLHVFIKTLVQEWFYVDI